MGLARQRGGLLLLAGTTGSGTPCLMSRIMIHQPWVSQIGGQATDIDIHAKQILLTRKRLDYPRRIARKQPLEKIERDTERDFYMSAQEAKDYGLIDKVISKETR